MLSHSGEGDRRVGGQMRPPPGGPGAVSARAVAVARGPGTRSRAGGVRAPRVLTPREEARLASPRQRGVRVRPRPRGSPALRCRVWSRGSSVRMSASHSPGRGRRACPAKLRAAAAPVLGDTRSHCSGVNVHVEMLGLALAAASGISASAKPSGRVAALPHVPEATPERPLLLHPGVVIWRCHYFSF